MYHSEPGSSISTRFARCARACGAALAATLVGFAATAGAQERPVTLDFTPLGPPPRGASRAAPADTSFGHYPMSPFGIENAIRRADADAAAFAAGAPLDDGPIAYAVVAIREWEHRFPTDPWIAKDLGALARFYGRVGSAAARDDERAAIDWLEHDYPASPAAVALASYVDDAEREPTSAAPVPVAATTSAPEKPFVKTPTWTFPTAPRPTWPPRKP